jgi:hypothetical protein
VGILLFLLGLLAAASGALKLRSRVRLLLGTSPLAVAEAVVGALTVLGSGVGLARMRPLAWVIVAVTSVMIVVSSVSHVRELRWRRKRAEASEAARLASHVQGVGSKN